MQDQDKNREQLIDELNEMRLRVAELETAEPRGQDIEKILKESEENTHLNRSSLISQDHPIENQELANIIDIPQIQSLMDDFYKLTNIGIAILDLKGNILVATGWQDICTKFHRRHPDTLRNCVESDLHLNEKVNEGEYLVYKCKNNMWDMVTPIVMGGKRVGNLYLGQFLFEDEVPDIEVFEAQAQRYGFNKDEYLAALNMVPRWSRDKVHTVMTFYSKFASMIGELSYSNLNLAKTLIESKILAETLRESEERHRRLVEHLPQRIFIKDRNSVYLSCNEKYASDLGITPEEIVGKDDFAFHPPELAQAYRADDQACMTSGMVKHFEEPYQPNGQERWVHIVKVPYHDEQGRVIGVLGISQDITERKLMQEALQASEEKYRNLFNNAGVGMFRSRLDGSEILDVNDKFLKILNRTREEIIGKPSVILWVDPHEREEMVRRLNTDGQVSDFEYKMLTAQGKERTCLTSLKLYSNQGIVEGSILNITDRKRLEEERLEMERKVLHAQKLESLNIMAGGIAHDFNNQLTVVLGNLELALMDLTPDSVARPSIQNAVEAAKRSAELSRKMQIYTGNTLYHSVDLYLNELLNRNLSQLKSCVSKHVTLNLEIGAKLSGIKGDADQIQHLIVNILDNASEAIGDTKGEVRLSTGVMDCDEAYLSRSRAVEHAEPGRFVFLEVSDTGCGMDAATQRQLFDPFFSTKFWGRGLGMAEALGIVKGHHGAIIVDSEVGKGTTIRVLFPVSKEAQTASVHVIDVVEPQPAVPVSPTRRKTILVVEDEKGVRDLAVTRLNLLGYDTIVAGDGEEGVRVFQERLNNIDLVMLDFKMPKMNGVEAFGELIRIEPDVKVILCSGYTEEAVIQSFPGQRPAGVLHKPYNMEELKGKLEYLFGTAD